jgi:hypothetical protein
LAKHAAFVLRSTIPCLWQETSRAVLSCAVPCCAIAEDIAREHPDLYRVWREEPERFCLEGRYPVLDAFRQSRRAWTGEHAGVWGGAGGKVRGVQSTQLALCLDQSVTSG